ncbi:unnamed protein product [Dicrocoelium dendriticum]|nr:unnamed protein product [Dicrocoelium dendriticum]
MYSSYLEEYHGALTEFHTRSFNLFTTQVSRDPACVEFLVGSSIRIWVSENHPAILFTCTDVFMRNNLLYTGNRLVGGLCHIRIWSKKINVLKICLLPNSVSGGLNGLSNVVMNVPLADRS